MRTWPTPPAILALLLAAACSGPLVQLDAERSDGGNAATALPSEPTRRAPEPDAPHSVSADASAPADGLDAGSPGRDSVDATLVADAMPAAADAMPAAQLDATPADAAVDARPREDAGRPPHSPTAVYTVQRYVGETERLTITKSDPKQAHCLMLITAFPARDVEPPDIVQPPMWLTRLYAVAVAPDGTCALGSDGVESQFSTKENGRLAWRELSAHGRPCRVDLDIEVSFRPTARIPAHDQFLVENLAVPCD